MLNDSITTTYKKASDNFHNKINTNGKKLMKDKEVLNWMLTKCKKECFITLKDHKPNFKNNPKVRLINLAKNEIGPISKTILGHQVLFLAQEGIQELLYLLVFVEHYTRVH